MVEQGVHRPIASRRTAEGIAVAQQEPETLMHGAVRVLHDLETDLALQPARSPAGAGPVVVVAAHERDSDPAANSSTQGSQQGLVTRGWRTSEVEPEVEDVAQEIEPLARLQPGEEGDQVAFLGQVQLGRAGSQVDVG